MHVATLSPAKSEVLSPCKRCLRLNINFSTENYCKLVNGKNVPAGRVATVGKRCAAIRTLSALWQKRDEEKNVAKEILE